MSSGAVTGIVAAAVFSCTTSNPTPLGAVPEDSKAKAHHLKHGAGFKNPWDSWKEMSALQIMWAMTK